MRSGFGNWFVLPLAFSVELSFLCIQLQTKIRKIILALCLAGIVALKATALGWLLASGAGHKILMTYAFHVVFALYIFVMAVMYVRLDTVNSHWKSTIHLTILTGIAVALLGTTAILPSYESPIKIQVASSTVLQGLWYSSFALYCMSFAITVTTPRGPKLNFPVERIYSKKTVSSITVMLDNNVCGITGLCYVRDVLRFY